MATPIASDDTVGSSSRPEDAETPTGRSAMGLGIELAERGWVPDPLLRIAIRRLVADRLAELQEPGDRRAALRDELAAGPIAVDTDLANDQHYEVPPEFFHQVLGPRMKYSCALYRPGVRDLEVAERDMLQLTACRAGVEDGMRVLDLGCGWGSFSLWLAESHPACRVLAVSNSKPQARWIRQQCEARGLDNLEVHTADANAFDPAETSFAGQLFDRIVSIEMFEHVRNWQALLARASTWLDPDGRLFLHTFCHRDRAYPFEDRGDDDWMARHFFSGGLMPSADWVLWHQRDFEVLDQWWVDGTHYQKTSEAWLARLDERRAAALAALAEGGEPDPARALQRWRLFFLAVAELFGFRGGREWFVQHALLAPRRAEG